MQDLSRKTVREIAVAAPAATRVFEEFKIDFCCAGNKLFGDACEAAGVDAGMIAEKLQAVLQAPPDRDVPEKMRPSALIKHIISEHHDFTRSEVGRLSGLADKVFAAHGEKHPELSVVREAFNVLGNDLISHMRKEEIVLFPYIEKLEDAAAGVRAPPQTPFGTINNPVRMMCLEHDETGNILNRIRRASNDFAIPPDACPSYNAFYAGLENLERDLHQHIHLENNVLFPQAVSMETKLNFHI